MPSCPILTYFRVEQGWNNCAFDVSLRPVLQTPVSREKGIVSKGNEIGKIPVPNSGHLSVSVEVEWFGWVFVWGESLVEVASIVGGNWREGWPATSQWRAEGANPKETEQRNLSVGPFTFYTHGTGKNPERFGAPGAGPSGRLSRGRAAPLT